MPQTVNEYLRRIEPRQVDLEEFNRGTRSSVRRRCASFRGAAAWRPSSR